MQDDLNKALMEAVEKNLPQATADNLKKLLEERENAIKEVGTLNTRLDEKARECKNLSDENQRLKSLELESDALKAERAKFEDEKRDFRVEKAEFKLAEAEKRANTVEKLVETVFKNRSMTVSSFTNGMMPVPSPNGAGFCPTQEPFSSSTTVTTDEQ